MMEKLGKSPVEGPLAWTNGLVELKINAYTKHNSN